jgi:thymidylate synthase
MNNLDVRYQALLQDIFDNGVTKSDRTGTGTISVFGRQIRHKMSDGFPLLTTKKMPFKTIVTELLWFLRGDTNIKYLVDNDCHIWDGDAYKNYERRWETEGKFLSPPVNKFTKEELINEIKINPMVAKELGELGPIYGKQWRKWNCLDKGFVNLKEGEEIEVDFNCINISHQVDQIQNLINDLKTNPDSRRLMVNAWNVGELDQMVLPPCHYGFQVYTRELSARERLEWVKVNLPNIDVNGFVNNDEYSHKWVETLSNNIPKRAISLMWNQRSVDTFLGLPFNIASYGLLLEIIAKEVNMVPDELIGNLGDTHLYLNHIEQAKEQIGRELTLKERRDLVNPEMFSQIYTAGDSSTLSHSEIDQWYIPRKTREPYPLPTLSYLDEYHYLTNKKLVGDIPFSKKIEEFRPDFFKVIDYQSHPTIKAPLSN